MTQPPQPERPGNRPGDDPAQHVGYERDATRVSGARALGRCISGILSAAGVLCLSILPMFVIDSIYVAWGALAVCAAAVVAWALTIRRRPGWRPFTAGLWIGLGLGGLLLGTCYAMLTSLEKAIG